LRDGWQSASRANCLGIQHDLDQDVENSVRERLIDAVTGFTQDLQALQSGRGGLQNILGAVQTAGTAYNTFNKSNIGQIAAAEAQATAKDILRQGLNGSMRQAINTGNGQLFPNAPKNPGTEVRSNILPTAGFPTIRTQLGL
jgi:hypothetical protein